MSALVRFCGATYELTLAPSFKIGDHPTFSAAFLDISLSAAAIFSITPGKRFRILVLFFAGSLCDPISNEHGMQLVRPRWRPPSAGRRKRSGSPPKLPPPDFWLARRTTVQAR